MTQRQPIGFDPRQLTAVQMSRPPSPEEIAETRRVQDMQVRTNAATIAAQVIASGERTGYTFQDLCRWIESYIKVGG